MTSDQGTEARVMHNSDYTAHPRYFNGPYLAQIGDLVVFTGKPNPGVADPDGEITAIYLDGMVELSTGDQVPASDLVLLRRAER